MTPEAGRSAATSGDLTAPALRPWQRLGVKLAVGFALLTLLTVGLVGGLINERQKREVEDTVGTQLLNIARTAVLLVDPALHAEVQTTLSRTSPAYTRIEKALASVQTETATLAQASQTTTARALMSTSSGICWRVSPSLSCGQVGIAWGSGQPT